MSSLSPDGAWLTIKRQIIASLLLKKEERAVAILGSLLLALVLGAQYTQVRRAPVAAAQ